MAADAKRLAADVEALDARTDAPKLEAEQTAEAIRQVEAIHGLRRAADRLTDPGALAAWREDNIELCEMEKTRKWMAERGIVLTDTTYTDLPRAPRRRQGRCREPRFRGGRHPQPLRRLSAAVDVLASLSVCRPHRCDGPRRDIAWAPGATGAA